MSFAHYLLQVNLYLIVFYGCYALLLNKETYFLMNRIYLIGTGILSLSIPFIRLEWLTEQKAAQQVYTSVNWDAVLQQAEIVTDSKTGFNWGNAFVYIYFAGVVFFLFRLIFSLLAVKKLIRHAKSGAAFSFFRKKIVDQNLPMTAVIDVHEEAHIKQWHSADIIFFEILGVFTWFNPIIYCYKKTIKNIHEFLADEHAAKFQGDKAAYAMLILSQTLGISPNRLTNSFFNKSLIKKRIFMLQKERSKKVAIVKYGVFIPLFAISIIFSSATIRKNENLISITDQIPMDKPLEVVQEMVEPTKEVKETPITENKIISTTEKVSGEWENFYRFMAKSIKYPVEARKNNLRGNTQIKFIIQNNKIIQVGSVLDLGEGCDEEVMKALLSYKGYKSLPDGKYTLKVGFILDGAIGRVKNPTTVNLSSFQKLADIHIIGHPVQATNNNLSDEKTDQVFDFVSIEKQPEFPGGLKKFYEYLAKNIKYPVQAQENNVQGKVFLSFIVEKDGTLSDIQITRGLGSGTDEEAVRVMSGSPKWNPGIAEGKPVRVKYNINVNFTISDDSGTKTANQSLPLKLNDGEVFKGIVMVDGVKLTANKYLNGIDPNTIESIEVLKDQNAMNLYGEKARDGAILITTKTAGNKKAFQKRNIPGLNIDKLPVYFNAQQKK